MKVAMINPKIGKVREVKVCWYFTNPDSDEVKSQKISGGINV